MADPSKSPAVEQPAPALVGSESAIIKPDDNPYASEDPAFLTDSDKASSTQSLSSSVLNYQYENGRRYHAYREGEYVLPNDEREQDRLDLYHHICRLITGGHLFRVPTDLSTARILDIGTGTGIWAIEMADEFPRADVTGIDLSPIQPGWVPPNCYFEVNDFESEWEFSKPFDLINGRATVGSVRDYPQLFERVLQNLNDGGWAQFGDFTAEVYADDGTLEKAPNSVKWCQLLQEASIEFGKPLHVIEKFKQWMTDSGFKNVTEEVYKVPLNPWAKHPKMKELGRYNQVNVVECLETYSLALFTRVLGWSIEEVTVFLAGVRQELVDRSIHLYSKYHIIYGQKQEE